MTIKVKIPKTEYFDTYDILIGKGLINRVGEIIKEYEPKDCDNKGFLIIIGEGASPHYLDIVKSSLKKAGYNNVKSIILGKEKINPSTDLIPIVIGGNRFHHLLNKIENYFYIPTTFLGMAHSAVMGKPRLVITDINCLNTLEYKYMMSGYSEIAKHAIIADFDFFEWLEAHGRSLFDGDENARIHAIKRSCQIKSNLIANPETIDLLKLGHLYADAMYKIAKTDLLHGELISVGIVAAFKFAHKIELCDDNSYKRVRRHLKSMSLPVSLYADYWDAQEIVDNMDFTKPIILPKRIGEMVEYKKNLDPKMLKIIANEMIERQ